MNMTWAIVRRRFPMDGKFLQTKYKHAELHNNKWEVAWQCLDLIATILTLPAL
jgi:hypothetical protein